VTLDLAPFAFRVKVAQETGQCLDYVADVAVLVTEIQRLQSGYEAMLELHAVVYDKASIGVGVSYAEMRAAGALEQGVKLAVDAFERGAR
jgi:hypothetical protein